MFERDGATDGTLTGANAEPIRVLCIGPDAERLDGVADRLADENARLSTRTTTDVDGTVGALGTSPIDCLVSDHRPTEFDGVALLERVRSIDESIPVVV